ncbi:transcription factor btf3 [Pyrenophora seminiperda CCB06]|uniref:Transcription factor btf3 n=1 Tax=Pyrenophora seminiperda CCB06 TaxID=1302712 RepID=A0A3M7MDV0_9PLEO|nr:transcription factor btf3 [Pyrenophora seminiperda CCB06]
MAAEYLPTHEDPSGVMGIGQGPQVISTSGALQVIMGPLLNYRRTSTQQSGQPIWHGSVLIVTTPGQQDANVAPANPQLVLSPAGAVERSMGDARFSVAERTFHGQKLYEDPKKAFWRFIIEAPMQPFESRWSYDIQGLDYTQGFKEEKPQVFVVPSISQSMRIMFHSCNGFSVGTDMDVWQGPSLWNDVLRMHEQRPFHVMIGGGDQIYNDGVRVDGPLKPWTAIGNPHKRREYPFDRKMRDECDEYYYNNYIRWYSTKPFSTANSQIPQVNIWDDHDIIDGFGSYTDHFMNCAVFRGIGGVAHKYYLLFQHHLAPPKSTYTTDAPETTAVDASGQETTPADVAQLQNTFVMTDDEGDSSYIIGQKPGPYVEERSRNIYCQLGARIAFAGIDARTERTRHVINYKETYDMIFERLDKEFSTNPELKHMVLLLGVPIAYPRLIWLENILQSPLIAPIKFLNKRFGFAGGFFNQFDGKVDLLDDLDDHYTARQHKQERRDLMHRLQKFSHKFSARVTILGGDVHLGAIGRFYSNPKAGLRAEEDWRYMPNIISSAITNKPPPQAVANLLARRNKIHHLDKETDETLLEIFDRDPALPDGVNATNGTNETAINGDGKDGKIEPKTSAKNHATMPSRNYAIICESMVPPSATLSAPGAAPGQAPSINTNGDAKSTLSEAPGPKDNMRHPFHLGEQSAGTQHPAAGGIQPTGLCGPHGLDVTLRVEISNKDREGRTDGYGFTIPALQVSDAMRQKGVNW